MMLSVLVAATVDATVGASDPARQHPPSLAKTSTTHHQIGAAANLKILNMEFNELKDIPASLGYLPSLSSLVCE